MFVSRSYLDIAAVQYYIFYAILAIMYLLFLRRVRKDLLSAFLFVLFNQGFLLLIGGSLSYPKILISLLTFAIYLSGNFRMHSKDLKVSWAFSLFSMLYFMNFYYFNVSLKVAIFQYYKYLIPFMLYLGLRSINIGEKKWDYLAGFVITLIAFQASFSIVKILVMGYLEGVIGSIAVSGGSMAVTLPLTGLIFYWIYKNESIKGRDWFYVAYILLIPIASVKRAIWFIYPIVFMALLLKNASLKNSRLIGAAIILTPLIFYFGLKINPTLNPEGKMWGSFDPGYALDYAFDYSGVSEDKQSGGLAQGRWGSSLALFDNILEHPFSINSVLGFPIVKSGTLDTDEFMAEDFGMMKGTMMAGIGYLFLKHGYVATLLLLYVFIGFAGGIRDRYLRLLLVFLLLWNVLMYSGGIISNPTQAILFILLCEYARVKYDAKAKLLRERNIQNTHFKPHEGKL